MALYLGLIVGLPIVLGMIAMVLSLYLRRRVIADLRKSLPASPLQILDRRLASGEISDEQYQYERYLLEQQK